MGQVSIYDQSNGIELDVIKVSYEAVHDIFVPFAENQEKKDEDNNNNQQDIPTEEKPED